MAVEYTFQIKRSSTPGYIPAAGSLLFGELAINYSDGRLFYRDKSNNVQYFSSNNSGISSQANSAFVKANVAYSIANSAYNQANVAFDTANSATLIGQSAFNKANIAFDSSNTAIHLSTLASDNSNAAISIATSAYNEANSVTSIAVYGSDKANASYSLTQEVYNNSNTNYLIAVYGSDKANSSYSLTQEVYGKANSKFDKGNTINFNNGSLVGTVSNNFVDLYANGTFVPRLNYSNTSLIYANQTSVVISFPEKSNNWVFDSNGKTWFPNDSIVAPSSKSISVASDALVRLNWKTINPRPQSPTESTIELDNGGVALITTRLDRNSNPVVSSWIFSPNGDLYSPNNQIQISATSVRLASDDNMSPPLISGSLGEKLILRDQAVLGKHSQAIGLEEGYIWFSQDTLDDSNNGFKFYSEGIPVVTIGGMGSISIGDPSGTPFTLPNSDGANNQILSTDGAGTVSWVDKFQSGEVIKMLMLPYDSIRQATGNTAAPNNTSWNNIAFYNYTFASSNSYLIAEYNTAWTTNSNAAGNDNVTANLALNGTSFSYSWQPSTSSSNEGQRASNLFPIMGRANSTGAGTTANVQVFFQRTSTDDTYYIYGDSSTWLKLTEVAK